MAGEEQHVYLIGICGTAMASLAGLLKQRGIRVSGSDAGAYPPMSDFLASLQIPVAQSYAAENLKPRPDFVVVGNAISRGNVELEYVLNERIPLRSMSQVLYDYFLRGREPIVVAGTHGKTTTTSMLAWIFQVAAKNPSFLIGGVAENFGSSFALKQSSHFIIEGDEYDTAFFDKGPKFLHYFPDSVILTSVEFDHADIYKDLDAVKMAFKRLVNLVPQRGKIIAFDASEDVSECLAKAFCPVERYGFSDQADWKIADLKFQEKEASWLVLRSGAPWANFEFSLGGEYNVLNATAAVAMAATYGIEIAPMQQALASFRSVKRRLEVKAQVNGITIVDDFAHHPTAIAQTLKALRTSYPKGRLWAILEPRSNTLRRNIFAKQLVDSLAIADEIVIASVFKAEAIPPGERLSVEEVVKDLQRQKSRPARQLADADAIVESIAPRLQPGDVVAILSNGGFGGIYEKLPAKLMQTEGITTS